MKIEANQNYIFQQLFFHCLLEKHSKIFKKSELFGGGLVILHRGFCPRPTTGKRRPAPSHLLKNALFRKTPKKPCIFQKMKRTRPPFPLDFHQVSFNYFLENIYKMLRKSPLFGGALRKWHPWFFGSPIHSDPSPDIIFTPSFSCISASSFWCRPGSAWWENPKIDGAYPAKQWKRF